MKAPGGVDWGSSAARYAQKGTPTTSFSLWSLGGPGTSGVRKKHPLQLLASALQWVMGNGAGARVKQPAWQPQGHPGGGWVGVGVCVWGGVGVCRLRNSEMTSGSSHKCHPGTEGPGDVSSHPRMSANVLFLETIKQLILSMYY